MKRPHVRVKDELDFIKNEMASLKLELYNLTRRIENLEVLARETHAAIVD
jgi:hypothetical protein